MTSYQTMVTTIQARITDAGAPVLVRASTAATITQMNDAIRGVLGPILELGRLFSQEVAYQQDIVNQYGRLDQSLRATFHGSMLGALRTSIVPIRALMNATYIIPGSTNSLADGIPELNPDGFNFSLQLKVLADILGGNAVGAPGTIPQDILDAAKIFETLLFELRQVHQTFRNLVILLDEIDTITALIPANGDLSPVAGLWPRSQRMAQARTNGGLNASEPAAFRELAALQDLPTINMLKAALDLLSSRLAPAVLAPVRGALQAAGTQVVTARQNALRSKWYYTLQTQRRVFLARQSSRANAARPGVVAPDLTGPELMALMQQHANGNAADLALLATLYTQGLVLGIVDGSIPMPAAPAPVP